MKKEKLTIKDEQTIQELHDDNIKAKSAYDANSIIALEQLEMPRKNPGMYIGSTGPRGLHHLVFEAIDNSIDEFLAGKCKQIWLHIFSDGSISIKDNGSGLPVGLHKKEKISVMRVMCEKLHAGGKFEKTHYKVSGGLHGVGLKVINSFSTFLNVESHRDGKIYSVKYENRKLTQDETVVGESKSTGTIIHFKPDPTALETVHFNYKTIRERIRESALLNKGLEIFIKDDRTGMEEVFLFERGITQYVEEITEDRKKLQKSVFYTEGSVQVEKKQYDEVKKEFIKKEEIVKVEMALQYLDEHTPGRVYSFANNIPMSEGGYHEQGFTAGLRSIINKQAEILGYRKEKAPLYTREDVLEGLVAIISIKMPYRPEFEGQTKNKLGNTEVKTPIENYIFSQLETYFLINQDECNAIVEKIDLAAQERVAAKQNKGKKKKEKVVNLFGKLDDATTKDRTKSEVYFVEGDSAGGSAKMAKDRVTQAVLPLRGKVLNTEKKNNKKIKIETNEEIKLIDATMGVGRLEECDTSKSRYGKYIILTDADQDGFHIRSLILTYIFRYKRKLIEQGYVYVARPPLYKIELSGSKKEKYFAFDLVELNKIKDDLEKKGKKIKGITRYKGLGEMNALDLKATCMNPKTRQIRKVTISDAIHSDNITNILMGDNSKQRTEYIQNKIDFKEIEI